MNMDHQPEEQRENGQKNLESPAYRQRLMRKLNCLIAVLEVATAKRRPPCPIPAGLRPHLERWRAADMARGWADVCHWNGQPSRSIKRSWATARAAAGLNADVTPHTLRHTCTTWLMQRGVPVAEVAGFVGLSLDMVDRVYGHHHPDHMSRAASRRPTIAND